MFVIGGIQKTTLVDFPKKVAAVVFTQGCNFRCGYCHNSELLTYPNLEEGSKSLISRLGEECKNFFDFLQTRKGKLDGVVITGGEPTLQSGLYDFIWNIKDLGFAVKLDTNGSNPEITEKLLNDNLLDYIAMDIKAPIKKYSEIVNVDVKTDNILRSINLIINSGIDYEFRTTVIKTQLSFDDFEKIGQMIKGAKQYYLQKFVPSKIFDKNLITEKTYSDNEFKLICKNLGKYVQYADWR